MKKDLPGRTCFLLILFFLFFYVFIPVSDGFGQIGTRSEICIPDVNGYLTLKCDFHMHTVFSDGNVWPTVRVEEAWRGGLDAIAITDHIENQPSKKDLKKNHNRSYEIAAGRAKYLDIVLIKAGEITRDMPPGHLNALFLEDVNKLDTETWQDAVKMAVDQGAFLTWNHPGWRQPDEIPVWYEEHEWLLEMGWIHGMEIVNERAYYPLVQKWCLDKKLTMIGCSDIHDPINMFFDFQGGEHRPMTLVFAEKRTVDGIKKALFARRTAVYYNNFLFGAEDYLKPIFYNSVEIKNSEITVTGKNRANIQIKNRSDLSFELIRENNPDEVSIPQNITLFAHKTVLMEVRGKSESLSDSKTLTFRYKVNNLSVAPAQGLPVEFKIKINLKPKPM